MPLVERPNNRPAMLGAARIAPSHSRGDGLWHPANEPIAFLSAYDKQEPGPFENN